MSEQLKQSPQKELQEMSLSQLASEVERAKAVKANLETLKAKNAKAFTEQQQNDLNSVTLYLVDAEEALVAKEAENAKEAEKVYTPAKGTEKLIHVSIIRGHRFDPKTGKEKTKPYTQLFTYGEFMLFSKNHSRLGFEIVEVLHDPYNVVKVN